MKRALLFLFLWLTVGFTAGTATLLGPVRWLTAHGRQAGWSEGAEDLAVKGVIVLLGLVSAGIAWLLARLIVSSSRREVTFGVPALCVLASAGCLWLWMNPGMLSLGMGPVENVGSRFTFGPYPDEARLAQLKSDGYTAVVPLLHPLVVPFEPKLLADEKNAAAKVGIDVIHLPMLPWVIENTESLERVKELAESGEGRYYVHCYLGKDRVSRVRRLVEQAGEVARFEGIERSRDLREAKAFERGDIYHLDDRVTLTPYPSDEELILYFLTGTVDHVVSLLDPENSEDAPWIEKEHDVLDRYGVPFTNLPVSLRSYDPHVALAVAERVRAIEGRVAVHAYLSPSTGRSPAAEAFMQAYRSGRPPLPPTWFVEPLKAGRAEVIAPHVATGPRPSGGEFGAVLARRGVREVLYVGDPASPEAAEDSAAAAGSRVAWRAVQPAAPEFLLESLDDGGPFYVYGPGMSDLRERISERFGPPVPPKIMTGTATAGENERRDPSPRAGAMPGGGEPGDTGITGTILAGIREFTNRALPSPRTIVLLGPLLALLAAGTAGVAGWLRVERQVRTSYTRKIFHFVIFSLAGVLHLTVGLSAVMLFGGIVSLIVLYAVIRGDQFPFYEALARPSDHPRRTLFIVVPLVTTALGGLLANVFFGAFATIGYLVGGWGDAVGEPVGAACGRHRYRVPSLGGVRAERSLEGSTAVLLAGVAAAIIGLLALGASPPAALGAGVACGALSAAVEAISTHGLDNLTVQVTAAGTAFLLIG